MTNAISKSARVLEEQRVQEEQSEQIRFILKPLPVQLGEVPPWLVKRIRERIRKPEGRPLYPQDYLHHAVAQAAGRDTWLDHFGSIRFPGGDKLFVSEPYLSIEGLKRAIRFAEMLDLTLEISPNSHWFPGRTTRLIFRPGK